jgi:ribulose-phosphate 3-epimerase
MENAASIMEAGADVLVAGNTVFRAKDAVNTIKQLKTINR